MAGANDFPGILGCRQRYTSRQKRRQRFHLHRHAGQADISLEPADREEPRSFPNELRVRLLDMDTSFHRAAVAGQTH